ALFKRLFGKSSKSRRRSAQETTETRSSRVSSILVSPSKLVAYEGQQIKFAAIGKDGNGETVQGARFNWASSDSNKLQIDDAGQATCLSSGLVWITASTSFVSARVPLLIRFGERPAQTDSQWQADQDQLRPDGTIGTGIGGFGGLIQSLTDSIAPTAYAQSGGADSNDFLYDEIWSEPRNLMGSPRNRVMDASRLGPVLPE